MGIDSLCHPLVDISLCSGHDSRKYLEYSKKQTTYALLTRMLYLGRRYSTKHHPIPGRIPKVPVAWLGLCSAISLPGAYLVQGLLPVQREMALLCLRHLVRDWERHIRSCSDHGRSHCR